MRRVLPLLALSLLAAAPAAAQINLAWRNCITVTTGGTSALANINYACDGSGATPIRAAVSFIAPPNMTQFVAVQFYLDISTPSATLPDWWRHGIGECRVGSFVAPASFTGVGTGATGSCQNPYTGSNTGTFFTYTSGSPTPGRATASIQLDRDTPRPLTASQQYLAFVFAVDTFKDVEQGSGVCAGCQIPACLSVTQLEVFQAEPLPSVVMTNADVRKSITWQGGTPGCAGATPARNHTWGAIKAIYR